MTLGPSAVRAAGSPIDWIVHPVLSLRRDAEGQLQDARPVAAGEASAESLIHIEFEPLRDAAGHAGLEADLRQVVADLHTVVVDFPAMRARLHEVGLVVGYKLRSGALMNDDGELTHYIGIYEDITQTKLAQQRIEPRTRQHFRHGGLGAASQSASIEKRPQMA